MEDRYDKNRSKVHERRKKHGVACRHDTRCRQSDGNERCARQDAKSCMRITALPSSVYSARKHLAIHWCNLGRVVPRHGLSGEGSNRTQIGVCKRDDFRHVCANLSRNLGRKMIGPRMIASKAIRVRLVMPWTQRGQRGDWHSIYISFSIVREGEGPNLQVKC